MLSWILETSLLQKVKERDIENEMKWNADGAVAKKIELELTR